MEAGRARFSTVDWIMASALTNVRASATDHPFSVLHSQFRCAGFCNALRLAGAVLLCELCETFAFFVFNEKGKRKERRPKPVKFAKKDF